MVGGGPPNHENNKCFDVLARTTFSTQPPQNGRHTPATMLPPRLLLLAVALTLVAAAPRQPLPSPIDGDIQKVRERMANRFNTRASLHLPKTR